MPNSTVPGMTSAGTLDGTELLYVVQGGQDRKATATQVASVGRQVLKANAIYYVSSSGSDVTGNGTIGSPWQTIQFALDYLASRIDFANFDVTIQLAAGTVGTPNVYLGFSVPYFTGGGNLIVETSDNNPLTTTVTETGTSLSTAVYVAQNNTTSIIIGGMTLTSSSAGASHLWAEFNSNVIVGSTNCPNIKFGSIGNGGSIILAKDHASIQVSPTAVVNIEPSAGCYAFLYVTTAAAVDVSRSGTAWTITGTPAFTAFFHADQSGNIFSVMDVGVNVTGNCTGPRYEVFSNSIVTIYPANVTSSPGSTSGTCVQATVVASVGGVRQYFTQTFQVGESQWVGGSITFYSSGSAAKTTLQQASSASGSCIYTLPTVIGNPGSVLTDTGGDGTLSWTTPISSIGGLPPASGLTGVRRMINDASSAPTFWGIATGSSAIVAPVISDGTSWRYG